MVGKPWFFVDGFRLQMPVFDQFLFETEDLWRSQGEQIMFFFSLPCWPRTFKRPENASHLGSFTPQQALRGALAMSTWAAHCV